MLDACLAAVLTWSIDTTLLPDPAGYRAAARYALHQWEPSGLRFTYVPTGGDLTIVADDTPGPWAAYQSGRSVHLNPASAYVQPWQYRPLLVHEIGHALGVPHNPDPRSVMNADAIGPRVTRHDISAIRSC